MAVKYRITGRVQGVYIGRDPRGFVTTPVDQVTVSFAGFEGDQHSGLTLRSGGRTKYYPRGTEIRNDRQVSIVSVEEMGQVAAALEVDEVLPEWLGANLLLSGIPQLSRLPPGTRLVFARGAVLHVEAENFPCVGPGKVIDAHHPGAEARRLFPKRGVHLRGVVACVEKPGVIAAGEEVTAETPEQHVYTPFPVPAV